MKPIRVGKYLWRYDQHLEMELRYIFDVWPHWDRSDAWAAVREAAAE